MFVVTDVVDEDWHHYVLPKTLMMFALSVLVLG